MSKKNREKIKGVLSAPSALLEWTLLVRSVSTMRKKVKHSATHSNNGDTLRKSLIHLPYNERDWCSLPQLNMQLLTRHSSFPWGPWCQAVDVWLPFCLSERRKRTREEQGRPRCVYAVCMLTGVLRTCAFPLCLVHSGKDNWFLTTLGEPTQESWWLRKTSLHKANSYRRKLGGLLWRGWAWTITPRNGEVEKPVEAWYILRQESLMGEAHSTSRDRLLPLVRKAAISTT